MNAVAVSTQVKRQEIACALDLHLFMITRMSHFSVVNHDFIFVTILLFFIPSSCIYVSLIIFL
jgi:hypothetical protein